MDNTVLEQPTMTKPIHLTELCVAKLKELITEPRFLRRMT